MKTHSRQRGNWKQLLLGNSLYLFLKAWVLGQYTHSFLLSCFQAFEKKTWFKENVVTNKDWWLLGLLSSRDCLAVSGSFLSLWNLSCGGVFCCFFVPLEVFVPTNRRGSSRLLEMKWASGSGLEDVVMFPFKHSHAMHFCFFQFYQCLFCSSTPYPVILIW